MKKRDDIKESLIPDTVEAIKAGNKETAIAYVEKMNAEWMALHDVYVDITALLLDFIAEKLGEESINDAWNFVGNIFYRPRAEAGRQLEHEDLIQRIAGTHRAHGSKFYIEEDDEKTVLNCTLCGSGGKLMSSGKLNTSDRHPMNHGTTQKAYPWSFNKEGIPYYCIHSAVWYGPAVPEGWPTKGIQNCEWGRQFDPEGNPVDEPCKTIVFKKGNKP